MASSPTFAERLRGRQPLLGTLVTLDCAAVVEILANAGTALPAGVTAGVRSTP